MAREEIRLGIVGLGNHSRTHVGALRKTGRKARFVACCDVRKDLAWAWANEVQCERVYNDVEDMARRETLDGIVLVTWPVQHRDQIRLFLRSGVRHVLCEKPLAMGASEALEVWAAARESDGVVMEGLMFRHHPAFRRFERLVASGEAGRVESLRGSFHWRDEEEAAADDPKREWIQRPECGGGVPFDFGCYVVHALNRLAPGRPVRVPAAGGRSEKYGTVARLYGTIEYEGGAVGLVEASFRADCSQELQVHGSRGVARLPVAWTVMGPSEIEFRHASGWCEFQTDRLAVHHESPYRLQMEDFLDAIEGRSAPRVSLAESVVSSVVLGELVRSLDERRPIDLEIPDDVLQAAARTRASTGARP